MPDLPGSGLRTAWRRGRSVGVDTCDVFPPSSFFRQRLQGPDFDAIGQLSRPESASRSLEHVRSRGIRRSSPMIIRPGTNRDHKRIRTVVTSAFRGNPYSDGREGAIIHSLRRSGGLTASLVAEANGNVVGHVAFSPVLIDGVPGDWYGLGPIAVRPDLQRRESGSNLSRQAPRSSRLA